VPLRLSSAPGVLKLSTQARSAVGSVRSVQSFTLRGVVSARAATAASMRAAASNPRIVVSGKKAVF
jgi:hypothetical protein